MEQVKLTLKVVTPMFMGGAQAGSAELRPASIKGLLRFWWRALHPTADSQALLREENRRFGGTGEGEGQSPFLITLRPDSQIKRLNAGTPVSSNVAYLGYGLASYKSKPKVVTTDREAIDAGSELSLHLTFRNPQYRQEIMESLWCLTHLGGLGSRSRRGFGSVIVSGTDPPDPLFSEPADSAGQLAERIRARLTAWPIARSTAEPEYTALSCLTRVRVLPARPDWKGAMGWVGREFSTYRKETTFQHDVAIVSGYLRGVEPHEAPRRAIFGLPHNYHFPGSGDTVQVEAVQGEMGLSRRASPLFIHFHELRDHKVVPVLTFIPARFLPQDARIVMRVGKKTSPPIDPPDDHTPILEFMKNLPGSIEVWP